jgi:hypothetical protein
LAARTTGARIPGPVSIDPLVLFSIQFTFALVAYALIARWYVWPRIGPLPVAVALVPLVWVHVFRFVGGSILAPGSVGPGVPSEFREMIGYGDMITAALALIAVLGLRAAGGRALWFVWVFVLVGLIDTANAVIQSMRFHVFDEPLGVNWLIVTAYVPALLVTSYLIIVVLLRARRTS